MTAFKNLNQLFKHVQKQLESAMNDEVADAVRHEQQKQIQKEVYDEYPYPYYYERRRFTDDGLQDIDVMVSEIKTTSNGVILSVVNLAKGQNQEHLYLAPLIEYGHSNGYGEYQYPYNRDSTAWKFLQPRPFTRATIEALERSGVHIRALKEGLKARGIDTV